MPRPPLQAKNQQPGGIFSRHPLFLSSASVPDRVQRAREKWRGPNGVV